MYTIRELSWREFANQPHIKKLPLNEQTRQFNFHLDEVANYHVWQNKGKKIVQTQEETGYLLQEDGEYLLQEDGSKIIWN